jgi:outer membrane immunogenic protein
MGADLAPMPTKAATTQTPPFNWSGVYFGVNGGGAWGNQDPFNVITNRFDEANINFSGGMGGGTVGVQLQESYLLVGLEGDFDWADIKGSSVLTPTILGVAQPFTLNATTKISRDATIRARVGYAHDNWLFFLTGGVALIHAETNLTTVSGVDPCTTLTVIGGTPGFLTCHGTNLRLGGTAGGGFEYGFTPNWSAKIEYRYTAAASLELSHINQVLVGVNYRFGLTP